MKKRSIFSNVTHAYLYYTFFIYKAPMVVASRRREDPSTGTYMVCTLAEKKSQHQEGVMLDKRNLVGVFIHLKEDVYSNFALDA